MQPVKSTAFSCDPSKIQPHTPPLYSDIGSVLQMIFPVCFEFLCLLREKHALFIPPAHFFLQIGSIL